MVQSLSTYHNACKVTLKRPEAAIIAKTRSKGINNLQQLRSLLPHEQVNPLGLHIEPEDRFYIGSARLTQGFSR